MGKICRASAARDCGARGSERAGAGAPIVARWFQVLRGQMSKIGKPFPPGVSGNPAGKAKGTRNRASLNARFIDDLASDWEKHGPEAIRIMRVERPGDYVRCVASLMPKAVTVTTEQAIQELTDEELVQTLATIREKL